jgi:radical SAM-linked protein
MKGTEGFPVRLRFSKHGKVRFVSHRDVARAFERAFRIEQLPLAFTLGFAPRPKVSFGLALSVGHESDAEYLDFELREAIDPEGLPVRLSDALPEGLEVTGAARLVDRAPALQEAVSLVEYRVTACDADDRVVGADPLQLAVDRARLSPALPVTRTRKGRESTDDVKPAIRTIELSSDEDGFAALELTLSTQSRGARPREVLDAISGDGILLTERRVLRTAQWIERDGARLEPLEADALARAQEARA